MDMPCCLALEGVFHGWGRDLVPFFNYFPHDFSMPWQARSIRSGIWRARIHWGVALDVQMNGRRADTTTAVASKWRRSPDLFLSGEGVGCGGWRPGLTVTGAMSSLLLIAMCVLSVTASPPNILVLIPDEWRWDWAGFDSGGGPSLSMPTTTALAERGTRFTHAVTPAPLCAPGRACLALGRNYDNTTMPDNHGDYAPSSSSNDAVAVR